MNGTILFVNYAKIAQFRRSDLDLHAYMAFIKVIILRGIKAIVAMAHFQIFSKMRRDTLPISTRIFATFNWSLSVTFLFAVLANCSIAASHPFNTGTFRYMPKHNFGSLYDGGRPHLPRSANEFFASQPSDRTVNSLISAMPDYLRSTGALSQSDLSGVQLFVPETINADEKAQSEGTTEQRQKNTRPANLHEFEGQKGQLARKNCFFSPLQCSFYYKKRSHHRRNARAPTDALILTSDGTVIGSRELAKRLVAF